MCVICKLYELEKLTAKEAMLATWELVSQEKEDVEHLRQLYGKLQELEESEEDLT